MKSRKKSKYYTHEVYIGGYPHVFTKKELSRARSRSLTPSGHLQKPRKSRFGKKRRK